MAQRIPRYEFIVTRTEEVRVTARSPYYIAKKMAASTPDHDCTVISFIVTEVSNGETYDCTDLYKRKQRKKLLSV